MKRHLGLIIRLLAVAAIIVGITFFVRGINVNALGHAFRTALIWPLVLSAILNFVCLWGKSVCWRIMLAPRYHVPIMRLFRYTTAAFAASAIAPMRAGEVLRVWVLKKRDGVPPADTAAVAVAEKVLDGMSMLIVCSPIPFLLPQLPSSVGKTLMIGVGIAIVLFAGLYIAVVRVDPAKPRFRWLRQFAAGLHVMRSPKRLAACTAMLIFVWLADLGEVMLVLHAVGIVLPIGGGLLILLALNLAIAVPSTPAQVGALELGALVATDMLGVPRELALAFALLYHLMQVVPLIIAGLVLELKLVLGTESAATTPAPTADVDAAS